MVVAFHAATLATGRALPLTRTGLSPVGTRQLSWRTKGRHFEASLIVQAVSWYLRYSAQLPRIEELFLERGLPVDHSTLNRWVLAYAPLIERRLRSFRKPHCGSIRIDETYIKIRGQWRYLYRAIDKHGTPVDFLLTAKRDLEARQALLPQDAERPALLAPDRIGTDGAAPYPPAIAAARKDGLLPHEPLHYVTKHLQQGIESDHSHGHVRGQGSGLGVSGSSPAVGSDPRSEPVSMTRSVCSTRSSSHTVAACCGCTNIPHSAGEAQEAGTILSVGW